MSKYSQEYYQLAKEYLECKKGLFTLLCLLLVFGMFPFILRFLLVEEFVEERIFNIPKGHYIALADFLSIFGVVVISIVLLIPIQKLVSLRQKMKSLS